jgi:ATP-dependent helicase/nuclease subunit A
MSDFHGPSCGQVDLLLDTGSGWILIDHKANPLGKSAFAKIGRRYSGQLEVYKDAIEPATARPVLESWLYFRVAAGAVSVEV